MCQHAIPHPGDFYLSTFGEFLVAIDTKADRVLLVLLARVVRAWKQALIIVQPETLLRWHREAFRLYWKHKSKAHSHKPKVPTETIALIRQMATNNPLLVPDRIPASLLKLPIPLCTRTTH